MPKRTDIHSVMIIGAGPIVIGQACEFDYSGAQACKALREEGYRVILANSNPATIMTDPDMADATYIEPLDWRTLGAIIERERPDALLPTMGGQTALNAALDLAREGVLEKFGVELIGASRDAIDKAEDRQRFREAMRHIGLETPKSVIAHNMDEARAALDGLGFPVILRPSFTMGGTGGGIAYNREEFEALCERGLDASPTTEVLLEESVLGWKEFEMEVVRDANDNCIIVCSIENFDPMGVHTGDSITVAPALTLTDKEYQHMRNASVAVLREIGVETGGSNVQFGVNPADGRMVVIEMNPRVSRSSALASKATGFPIARVAAKLAVGYTLDELANEITGGVTPASFEPSIDYVVTKIPRFNFEKFPEADPLLTTQMKSVGEAMAIGRTFCESLQKALRSLETGLDGLNSVVSVEETQDIEARVEAELRTPGPQRLLYLADGLRLGLSEEQIFAMSAVDPWFIAQLNMLIRAEDSLAGQRLDEVDAGRMFALKRLGFADSRLATLIGVSESEVRDRRKALGINPVYKRVDSCAAEFPATTAYMYSTYEDECEAQPTNARKIMVLGGGPNRIGQGIEFDYCCVHASLAARDAGFESIMVNCNPETVSTDYDTSDRLYFEPLTFEDVLAIVEKEKPEGVIVQYGGQTPLKLARALEAAGVPVAGTSPDSIDLAEDRERFQQFVQDLGLKQPANRIARNRDEAMRQAGEIGYPLVVRPSYVLGGRAMEIVYDDIDLEHYLAGTAGLFTEGVNANPASSERSTQSAPVLLDRFLDAAIEIDVDAVSDGENVLIGGIMEHVEQAGVHSGDSACSLPPCTLSDELQARIAEQTCAIARGLRVIGLMNIQFAVQGEEIYLLEVNPRASRTAPFVSKATGRPLARMGVLCKLGRTLIDQGYGDELERPLPLDHFCVKEAVFPFVKFLGVDPLLGPEMKSTGEVMGLGQTFGEAFDKAWLGAGDVLPTEGSAFISVRDRDKEDAVEIARDLVSLGFTVIATAGTAAALARAGVPAETVHKVNQGRPHVVDRLKNDEIDFIVNTTEGRLAIADSFSIRRSALQHKVPYTTTIAAARATVLAIRQRRDNAGAINVTRLQQLHSSMHA